MTLQYKISSESLFSSKFPVLLLEIWTSPSQYLSGILSNSSEYTFLHSIENTIQVFQNLNGNKFFAMNIYDNSETNLYVYYISYGISNSMSEQENELRVFLCNTENFSKFSEAAVMYCEMNQDPRIKLVFSCDTINYPTLEASFNAYYQRKQKIDQTSFALYTELTCYICKQFSYEPYKLACCNIILCKKCSSCEKCLNCTASLIRQELTVAMISQNLPYFCPCGSKIPYKNIRDHSKNCNVAYYKCNLCNQLLSFLDFILHLKNQHAGEIESKNIF